MTTPARIIFASSSPIALPCLKALIASEHNIAAVYTQPDRPAGRGRKIQANAIKACALQHDIPVHQPQKLDATACQTWQELSADLAVVLAYGLILPEAALHAPKHGCLNVHFSLLPKWRGAAPIQAAILHGEQKTGISFMQMDKGLDTGPVYKQLSLELEAHINSAQLSEQLAQLTEKNIVAVCADILSGKLTATTQQHELASHAGKIHKTDGRIDWRKSSIEIDRQVRAYNPWPVTYCQQDEDNIRIWQTTPLNSNIQQAKPGTIINASAAGLDIACGTGVLRITQLQLANKRCMAVAEVLHAHKERFAINNVLN